jgi:hypothetical protein
MEDEEEDNLMEIDANAFMQACPSSSAQIRT